MARPKKQTVEYFPHYCNHSSTIFVLEQKYKNDGYAFWFKLLELLASTEGHLYDCKNMAKWEFLQARTNLTSEKCNEILCILVNLGAIDKKAWQNKVIWCQNFVDGIADVYNKRKVEMPIKPSFGHQKPRLDIVSEESTPKVEDSKVNESKKKNINYEEVSKKYHIILTDLSKFTWNKTRKNHLKARINDDVSRESLLWWDNYFTKIKESDFLCGKIIPINGRKVFKANIDWIINESNMSKIIEDRYINTKEIQVGPSGAKVIEGKYDHKFKKATKENLQ